MALPDSFSEWEHLQSTLITYHNKGVRAEFADIEPDDALDIPRGSLKRACLLKDDDTVDMTLLRLHLFFFHARKAADLQAPIYGIPITDLDERGRCCINRKELRLPPSARDLRSDRNTNRLC
jgi:hypothetical protein